MQFCLDRGKVILKLMGYGTRLSWKCFADVLAFFRTHVLISSTIFLLAVLTYAPLQLTTDAGA